MCVGKDRVVVIVGCVGGSVLNEVCMEVTGCVGVEWVGGFSLSLLVLTK